MSIETTIENGILTYAAKLATNDSFDSVNHSTNHLDCVTFAGNNSRWIVNPLAAMIANLIYAGWVITVETEGRNILKGNDAASFRFISSFETDGSSDVSLVRWHSDLMVIKVKGTIYTFPFTKGTSIKARKITGDEALDKLISVPCIKLEYDSTVKEKLGTYDIWDITATTPDTRFFNGIIKSYSTEKIARSSWDPKILHVPDFDQHLISHSVGVIVSDPKELFGYLVTAGYHTTYNSDDIRKMIEGFQTGDSYLVRCSQNSLTAIDVDELKFHLHRAEVKE